MRGHMGEQLLSGTIDRSPIAADLSFDAQWRSYNNLRTHLGMNPLDPMTGLEVAPQQVEVPAAVAEGQLALAGVGHNLEG